MSEMDSLLRLLDPSDPQQALWKSCGLLPSISAREDKVWIARAQYDRLKQLTASKFDWGVGPNLPDDLFTPPVIAELGAFSCLAQGTGTLTPSIAPLWMQLLPLWLEDQSVATEKISNPSWHEVDIAGYRAYSLNVALNAISARSIERHNNLAASRSGLFSRSANYMGSKAALASQLLDIVDATQSSDTIIVDLMCGSGVMASAFARQFPTIASDAQEFCRLLSLIQGGGMTRARGEEIAQRVIHGARRRFNNLSDEVRHAIDDESQLVNSELAVDITDDLLHRLHERLELWEKENLGSLEAVQTAYSSGRLLSHLYGGVFFGDRQAAELDCLRQSITDLPDELERKWALGALVCAASACAYTYGGHFAQPKLNISTSGKSRGDVSEALKQRSLSVTHEFFIRLTSLAQESENVAHTVKLVPGPWENAIPSIASNCGLGPVCVYIDPPYTRDEYSRYYHVLEAIVRYQPQAVSGKGRLPKRGSAGRFASKFSGRRADIMEAEIARTLQTCLNQGWKCLWSYSDSGIASINGTLDRLKDHAKTADIFCMNHSYKAQGKRNQKKVIEYAIHLSPRN